MLHDMCKLLHVGQCFWPTRWHSLPSSTLDVLKLKQLKLDDGNSHDMMAQQLCFVRKTVL